MKIAVIGGGSWGTALAQMLAGKGYDISLLVRQQHVADAIASTRMNSAYLPGVRLHANIRPTTDREEALSGASYFLFSVPCQFFRATLRDLKPFLPHGAVIVCSNKGIEVDSGKTVSEMVQEELGEIAPRYAMLSGPSFAADVVRGRPTAIVMGCADAELGRELREIFSTPSFRVYSCTDVRGVELGGALKNVIAIAAGMSDGMGFGDNARAALITRGLAEMSRLGEALGARPATFMGLSGMGDLVLTCTGDLSRNRRVGLRLGQGVPLSQILDEMHQVAEGVKTTQAVYALGCRLGVELPITNAMHAVMFGGKAPQAAWQELMTRELKEE
ncbi:NAD(P)-dependent glycerol-3-phosphate dehydrogenase [Desulfovibrio mangrovi]|uniref:NAD(P)H-dependent glycerol-3-phosphate dehydrogenase n=1 Tax=Desulfovibrio mangrovi TaxID=2976983 RepID=UPI002248075F|nr:NAD(P)H-dependent glycerol-3-phosphate dehydrogenase [Desulfovibrio mangrovi]UZP66219.1 NAD(P)-dependent glycerol-3-phosphate dehydrogenase [Desulfovibrio mangrovi]